ncbi:MAG: hypothetical protein HRT74_07245 [Flavobacteriales bacterium]|nr:hypothetical protein [Flavobacteriales bacterium]
MSKKDTYKDLNDHVLALESTLKQLNAGHLSVEELDDAVNSAREIYERFIVIRHRALDKEVKGGNAKPIPFQIPTIGRNQTSLIDAIEEAETTESQTKQKAEKKTPAQEGGLLFVTDEIEEEQEEEVKEERAEEVEELVEEVEVAEVENEVDAVSSEDSASDQISELEEEPQPEEKPEPVIQKEAETETASATATLAEKLEKTPIADLKSAISLNRKFQFINVLFDGDADKYENAIQQLNTNQTADEAVAWVNENLTMTFEDEDHQAVIDFFVDLVERRHS